MSEVCEEYLYPGVRQDESSVTPAQLRLAQPELLRHVSLDDAQGLPEEVSEEVAEPQQREGQHLASAHGPHTAGRYCF